MVSQFPEWNWTVLAMPPRHFSWRIRGNALHFADSLSKLDTKFDLVLASSMVDFSTLLALRPELATVRSLLYFHENQLAYPLSDKQHRSLEPAMVNIYAAMASSRVIFNSEFNRVTFLDGLRALLGKFPDCVPRGIVDSIQEKSEVLPVPLDDSLFEHEGNDVDCGENSIVWNHRWEYDKSPERLLAFLQALPDDFELAVHVLGQSFKNSPKCMADIKARLTATGRLGRWGFVKSRDEYLAILKRSKYVLSTALHDFQGLSILEATALGCLPVVPDRLAYREFIPERYRYQGYLSGARAIELEASSAVELITSMANQDVNRVLLPHLSWQTLESRWRAAISA